MANLLHARECTGRLGRVGRLLLPRGLWKRLGQWTGAPGRAVAVVGIRVPVALRDRNNWLRLWWRGQARVLCWAGGGGTAICQQTMRRVEVGDAHGGVMDIFVVLYWLCGRWWRGNKVGVIQTA